MNTPTGKLRLWALFIILNLSGFALMIMAWMKGWIDLVVTRDTSGICIVIFALFLLGLFLCYMRIRSLSRNFDELKTGDAEWIRTYRRVAERDRGQALEGLRIWAGKKLAWINFVQYHLPALGLFGTVLGIAMGMETSMVANADSIASMVDKIFFQIMGGLAVAFYTTIVGMIYMIWLGINLKLVELESLKLIEEVLSDSGERAEALPAEAEATQEAPKLSEEPKAAEEQKPEDNHSDSPQA